VAFNNLATAQEAKEGKKKGMPTVEQQMERMTEALKLTDEQKPKVEAVLKDMAKKREDLRDVPQDERRDKARALRDEQDKKMKEILTPEQYEKYQAMPRGGRGGGKKEGEKKD
jgi:Spy/CpxP family protein refolding chaperone